MNELLAGEANRGEKGHRSVIGFVIYAYEDDRWSFESFPWPPWEKQAWSKLKINYWGTEWNEKSTDTIQREQSEENPREEGTQNSRERDTQECGESERIRSQI